MALKLQEPVSVFAALHDGALLLLVLIKGAATAVYGVLEAVQLRLVHLGEVVDEDVEVLFIIVHTHIIAATSVQRNSLEKPPYAQRFISGVTLSWPAVYVSYKVSRVCRRSRIAGSSKGRSLNKDALPQDIVIGLRHVLGVTRPLAPD